MQFGLVIDLTRQTPDQRMEQVNEEVLELVRMAEAGGFHSAYAAEHHTIEFIVGPNPFQVLVYWGSHTKTIRLGTAVAVAPYWHPIRLAGEAALADVLTGGRLEFGIGRGAYQHEFDRMAGGMIQQKGGAYMREMLPAIFKLWRGDYAHDGDLWKWPKATSVPKPLQNPLPTWVAARDPDTFDFAIKNGCDIMSTPLSKPFAECEALAAKLRKSIADNPGYRRPRWSILRRACVYDAPDGWRVPVECSIRYGRGFENLFRQLGDVHNGFPELISFEDAQDKAIYHPDAVRTSMVFGTPPEVVSHLRKYEAIGCDIFLFGMSYGLPHDVAKRSLRLFIDEVMPHFAEKAAKGVAAQ